MPGVDPLPWDRVLECVRTHAPALYRAWFDTLPPGRLEAGELRVTARSASQTAYLRERCTQAFLQCAMALSGRLVPVRFVTDGDVQPGDAGTGGALGNPLCVDYTFEEFVVGSCNRLAHAACRAVCDQPGTAYNPLFIHGQADLGKSHLVQATCAALAEGPRADDVVYVPCDALVQQYISAIEGGQVQSFRDRIRGAAVLVVDDVDYLAERESSQEEFFHTFNALYQTRRQLILTARVPPSQIPTLEDRLVSRFNWGLVVQMDLPARETRQAILQKKAHMRGFDIPAEVIDFIAARTPSTARALDDALTLLLSRTQAQNRPLTLDAARELLGSDPTEPRPPQISEIIDTVAKYYGVRLQELLGRRRSRSISQPRQVAMYLARRLTPLSLEEIGMHFGGRDHSTVLHAERVIDSEREQDPTTADALSILTRRLTMRS